MSSKDNLLILESYREILFKKYVDHLYIIGCSEGEIIDVLKEADLWDEFSTIYEEKYNPYKSGGELLID